MGYRSVDDETSTKNVVNETTENVENETTSNVRQESTESDTTDAPDVVDVDEKETTLANDVLMSSVVGSSITIDELDVSVIRGKVVKPPHENDTENVTQNVLKNVTKNIATNVTEIGVYHHDDDDNDDSDADVKVNDVTENEVEADADDDVNENDITENDEDDDEEEIDDHHEYGSEMTTEDDANSDVETATQNVDAETASVGRTVIKDGFLVSAGHHSSDESGKNIRFLKHSKKQYFLC